MGKFMGAGIEGGDCYSEVFVKVREGEILIYNVQSPLGIEVHKKKDIRSVVTLGYVGVSYDTA